MSNYQDFVKQKNLTVKPSGFAVQSALNPHLKDFQRDIVTLALKLGRFCIWAGCGMGKTLMQLEWASQVYQHTGKDVLIVAPLAVARQTKQESEKFGITSPVNVIRSQNDVQPGISIVNYEVLHKIDPLHFVGVVLDESSILKAYNGKTRNSIIESFECTPYKLACSATPSPNDHMELGSHAEFVGVMTSNEMLSMFFTRDGSTLGTWRLKGHAQSKFWEWVCSWAIMIQKPSDLGYSDEGYNLPPLNYHAHVTETDAMSPVDNQLFVMEASTLSERRKARKASLEDRVLTAADLVNDSDDRWLVWCDLNDESKMLAQYINGAVEVTGSDKPEKKEQAMIDFANGKIRVLVSKPSICGFGMNFQVCHNTVFVGLSDSFEAYYQAIRRVYRFGQSKPVNCHVIYDRLEGAVIRNIERKEQQMEQMLDGMVAHMKTISFSLLRPNYRPKTQYNPVVTMRLPGWLTSQ